MGGTPILGHFSPILAILKIFTSVLTFFLQKCPKSGLVSFKKYIIFFVTLAGGVRGGLAPFLYLVKINGLTYDTCPNCFTF